MEKFEISQEDINQYAANGGDLGELTDEQRKGIPQDVINQRAANDGDLGRLTDEQIRDIMCALLEDKMYESEISQEDINQYVAYGGDLGRLTDEQREEIPQDAVNQRAAYDGDLGGLTDEQRKAIPRGILVFDEKMRNALILYAAGKIKKDDLPNEVYANCKSRRILLGIIKTKLIKKFNQICDEKGFGEDVPHELKKVFDEKCAQIQQEVREKQQQAVSQLGKEHKGLVENAKREVEGMGW